jgi:putative endonuclease
MRRPHCDEGARGPLITRDDAGTSRDRCPVDVRPVFVYILASKTRVLYVGVTNDLIRRQWEHRTGAVPGFTRRYGVDKLVYYEFSAGPARAIAREKQIKGWARSKKPALIDSMNPAWNDFAELWFVDVSSDDPSPSLGVTPWSVAESSG